METPEGHGFSFEKKDYKIKASERTGPYLCASYINLSAI